MALSPTKQALLRQPFTAAAVKFRPAVKKPDKNGGVRCLTYIDSRLAAERLTEVDPEWTFKYKWDADDVGDPLGSRHNFPVRGILTVGGVTREDVGQNASSLIDDKHAKSAVSDALKRSAVLFGVGSYLYALGDARVSSGGYWIKSDGGVGGLNADGAKQLRSWYENRISEKSFIDRFGKPIDYGDVVSEAEEEKEVPDVAPAVAKKAARKKAATKPSVAITSDVIAAIGDIVERTGGNRAASEKWATSYSPDDAVGIMMTKLKRNGKLTIDIARDVLTKHGLERFIETFEAIEVTNGNE